MVSPTSAALPQVCVLHSTFCLSQRLPTNNKPLTRLDSQLTTNHLATNNQQLSTLNYQPMTKRTTHRSSTGKKLYAVRDKSGKFKDIQTYKRAHAADLKRKSKAEKKT